MLAIDVKLQRIEIEKFDIKGKVEFKIFFNDGSNKALVYETDMADAEGDSAKIMTKIRNYEKELNSKDLDHDSFLDSFVNVRIADEEKAEGRITIFIAKVREKAKNLKGYGAHSGYLDSMNVAKGMKQDLD